MAIDSDLACTITLTSGSKDFTIAGASLVTADIQPGDEIKLPLKGLTLTIGEVLTATTGKLTDNCPAAAAGAAQAARLRYQSDLSRAAAKFENLTTLLGNGNVDALAGLTLAANKGIHATGLNTLGTHDLTAFARTLLDDGDAATARSTLGALGPTETPDKAFRRGNILGPVSQSGGAPTGAIIERGSNANGEYVRFADRTQICTHSVVAQAPTSPTGSGFQSPDVATWIFPSIFIVSPQVSALGHYSSGPARAWMSISPPTTTAVFVISHSFVSGSIVGSSMIAIGRWF